MYLYSIPEFIIGIVFSHDNLGFFEIVMIHIRIKEFTINANIIIIQKS